MFVTVRALLCENAGTAPSIKIANANKTAFNRIPLPRLSKDNTKRILIAPKICGRLKAKAQADPAVKARCAKSILEILVVKQILDRPERTQAVL